MRDVSSNKMPRVTASAEGVLRHYARIASTGTEYDTEADREVVVDTLIRSVHHSVQDKELI